MFMFVCVNQHLSARSDVSVCARRSKIGLDSSLQVEHVEPNLFIWHISHDKLGGLEIKAPDKNYTCQKCNVTIERMLLRWLWFITKLAV